MSIANKIYTFPRIIRTLSDIISSDEEHSGEKVLTVKERERERSNRQVIDLKGFKRKENRGKELDHSKVYEGKE